MKRIAVIEGRFYCVHHAVDQREPSLGWCSRGGRCSFDECNHLEALEAHDEKVRVEEKETYDAALADYKRLFAQEIGNMNAANEYHIELAKCLRKENDALLAGRSAVRAEERKKYDAEIARLHEILGQPPIVVMQSQAVLMKENAALRERLESVPNECNACPDVRALKNRIAELEKR